MFDVKTRISIEGGVSLKLSQQVEPNHLLPVDQKRRKEKNTILEPMNQMGPDGGEVDRAFQELDSSGESMLPAAIFCLFPFT